MQLVDRVVAIVGDTAILQSEVLEEILRRRAQLGKIPPLGTPAFDSLLAVTLNDMVDRSVVLQRAKRSEVVITKDELDAETEKRFREIRNSFPSAVKFQKAIVESGRNLMQYRQILRAQVRADLLVDRFIRSNQQNLPPVSVTDDEIAAYYAEHFSEAVRPSTISFEQVVLEPRPAQAALDSARAIALKALQEIRDGADFAVVARRYSQDPSNRDQGGDLGWVRRSQVVPTFADAAWSGRSGEPIGPVLTRFGYHLIKVENVRGGERRLRHILIRPTIVPADVERARKLGEMVADSIRAGVPSQTLADRYGVPEETVPVADLPIDQIGQRLGPSYARALATPIPGSVVGPFQIRGFTPDRPRFVVLKVVDFRPKGSYDLNEIREQIRAKLLYDKGFNEFLAELKNEIYVHILL